LQRNPGETGVRKKTKREKGKETVSHPGIELRLTILEESNPIRGAGKVIKELMVGRKKRIEAYLPPKEKR